MKSLVVLLLALTVALGVPHGLMDDWVADPKLVLPHAIQGQVAHGKPADGSHETKIERIQVTGDELGPPVQNKLVQKSNNTEQLSPPVQGKLEEQSPVVQEDLLEPTLDMQLIPVSHEKQADWRPVIQVEQAEPWIPGETTKENSVKLSPVTPEKQQLNPVVKMDPEEPSPVGKMDPETLSPVVKIDPEEQSLVVKMDPEEFSLVQQERPEEIVAPVMEEGFLKKGQAAEEVGPAAEEVGPAAEKFGPAAKEVGPAAEKFGPAAEKFGPAAEEVGPAAEKFGPAAEEVGPAEEEFEPAAEEVGPAAEKFEPAAEEVGPSVEEVGPAAEEFGPAAEEVGPAVEEVGPAAEEVGLAAEEVDQLEQDTDAEMEEELLRMEMENPKIGKPDMRNQEEPEMRFDVGEPRIEEPDQMEPRGEMKPGVELDPEVEMGSDEQMLSDGETASEDEMENSFDKFLTQEEKSGPKLLLKEEPGIEVENYNIMADQRIRELEGNMQDTPFGENPILTDYTNFGEEPVKDTSMIEGEPFLVKEPTMELEPEMGEVPLTGGYQRNNLAGMAEEPIMELEPLEAEASFNDEPLPLEDQFRFSQRPLMEQPMMDGAVYLGEEPEMERRSLKVGEEEELMENMVEYTGRGSCQVLDGKCYRFFRGPKRATDAEHYCQANFPRGHLASITSYTVHRHVMDLMQQEIGQYTRTWVGGLRYVDTGRFIWLDGSHWSYQDWLPGEPNHTSGVEHCLELLAAGNGKFNDMPCWDLRAFVCSWPVEEQRNPDTYLN